MKYLHTLILLFLVYSARAQYDTLYVAVLPFTCNSAKSTAYVQAVENLVEETFATDHRVVLLERNAVDAVVREREYQKSEDFIDGEIVEQGKAIGAEYLVEGHYNNKVDHLTLKVFNAGDASLMGTRVITSSSKEKEPSGKLLKALTKLTNAVDKLNGTSSSSRRRSPNSYQIQEGVETLMTDCFSEAFIYVIRPMDASKSKAKELLIAGGTKMGLKKNAIVEVQAIVLEDVNGTQVERMEAIAWGRIDKVESDVFSVLKLEKGAKEVKVRLDKGQKLICKKAKR